LEGFDFAPEIRKAFAAVSVVQRAMLNAASVNFAVHVYCKIPQRTVRYHTAEFAVFCSRLPEYLAVF
jgi:hypothetical protein